MSIIDAILAAVGKPTIQRAEGREFLALPPGWNTPSPRARQSPEPLAVASLTALVSYLIECPDGNDWPLFVHVVHPARVSVYAAIGHEDEGFVRHEFMRASPAANMFHFDTWLSPEHAIISLQANFIRTPTLNELVALLSNLKEEAVRETIDNGFAQQEVVTKGGIAMRERATVPNPIELQPYRTFYEIEQPKSSYVLRLRSRDDAKPEMALYEAEGGIWRQQAVTAIARWLHDELVKQGRPGIAIIA